MYSEIRHIQAHTSPQEEEMPGKLITQAEFDRAQDNARGIVAADDARNSSLEHQQLEFNTQLPHETQKVTPRVDLSPVQKGHPTLYYLFQQTCARPPKSIIEMLMAVFPVDIRDEVMKAFGHDAASQSIPGHCRKTWEKHSSRQQMDTSPFMGIRSALLLRGR
jgi:hypothetical protein